MTPSPSTLAPNKAAPGAREQTTTGGVILISSSVLAALLLVAGLIYAAGTGQRHAAALAAAGCVPSLSPAGLPCTTYKMLASEYLATITPASEQLDADVAAYKASEQHNLATAKEALRAEVAAQHALDASLAAFRFPPDVVPIARALIRAGQARAAIIARQARSSSLKRLRSFNHRVQVASAAVQTELDLVRKAVVR